MRASDDPRKQLSTAVAFIEASAVVAARGELDPLTSGSLDGELNAAIDRGARSLVVDVAELGFMDASGLTVLIAASNRVLPRGGTVTLRSPSGMVRRLLDLTGLHHLAEPPVDGIDTPGPERAGGAPAPAAARADSSRAGHQASLVTAIPVDNDVVDSALRLVVALARATVRGADGVSASLRRHGQLSTVAATDQTISDMDAEQYATSEGPCVSASVEGRWFHVPSLDDEQRWPDFIPQAKGLGINSILSTPLTASGEPIGSLNIYSRTVAAFAPADQELAAMFSAEASALLSHTGVDVVADQLAERLQHALRTRQDIAQAQGVIMGRDGVDPDSAYATLRRASVASDHPLGELARAVVNPVREPGAAPLETGLP